MATMHVATGGSNLLLRKQPGTDQPILARLPNGTNVEVLDPTPVNNWFHVSVTLSGTNFDGWAFGNFLKPGPAGPQIAVSLPMGTLGMNLPYLNFYGTAGAPSGITSAIWDDQRKILNDLNVKAVRFFVTHRDVTDSIDRLHHTLNALGSIKAILCLIDVFSEKGLILKLDDPFYDLHTDSGNKLHPRYYIKQGYTKKDGYLDYAEGAAAAMSSHSNILYWEIGNELTVNIPHEPNTKEQGDAFLTFAESAVNAIRRGDPKAKVSTGLVSSTHVAPTDGSTTREAYTKELYSLFDAVSLHYYREDDALAGIGVDLAIAQQPPAKPVYLGELGADVNKGNRKGYYQQEILAAKKNRGIFMVMPWDMGAPLSTGFGSDRGLAWKHPDIGDVLDGLKNPL